jgi:hypothetical protein
MGMQYRYFVELTEQVDRVRALLAARSGALSHRGLDLSYAFARQLYFSGMADEGLYGLWARAQGLPSVDPGPLSSSAVALLAQFWFGRDAARAITPRSLQIRSLFAHLRLLAGRGGGMPKPLASAPPILLFAHSLRFARFLEPVAQKLGVRCAFLLAAEDAVTREWVARRGHAVRLYHKATLGLRRSGSVLARHAPGLALFADEIEAALAGSGAKVVLLPEGNAPVDEIVSQVGRRNGITVACLQQGWSPLVHTGFRNMSYSEMLVWGEGFAETLRPYNPGQSFCAVGNFQLMDTLFDANARPYGLAFFCQGGGGWTCLDDEAQMIELACRVGTALPTLPVFVRSHPVAPFDADTQARLARFPNIRISDPAQQSLAEVLSQVSCGVSIYSSTILECVASGIVPVIFNITTMPHYAPNLAAAGAGIEVSDSDVAFAALLRLMSEPGALDGFMPALARLQADYFAARGEFALERIVQELARLANGV